MKQIVNLTLCYKKYLSLLNKLALGLFSCIAFQAQAIITCGPYDPNYVKDINIPVLGPAIATIPEDLAVGSVIYGYNYNIAYPIDIGWDCSWDSGTAPVTIDYFYRFQAITFPSGTPSQTGTMTIFPTNVPGIGVTFRDSITKGSTNQIYPLEYPRGPYVATSATGSKGLTPGGSQIGIELIKTGPINTAGDQQVLAASFPTLQATMGMYSPVSFEHNFWTIRFNGAINFVTRTCQADDVEVNLGSYQSADFPSSGSTSDWKDFNITLRNCPPFYGYVNLYTRFSYSESTGLTSGTGEIKSNALRLNFTSVHGNYTSYIAKTESGPGMAEGLGIQVATASSTTANINTSGSSNYTNTTLGVTLTNIDGANYVIPLKARYYRYGAIQPGKANGAVIYTVTYL